MLAEQLGEGTIEGDCFNFLLFLHSYKNHPNKKK